MTQGWIVSSHGFKVHTSPEAAEKEACRLATITGKTYRVYRVKATDVAVVQPPPKLAEVEPHPIDEPDFMKAELVEETGTDRFINTTLNILRQKNVQLPRMEVSARTRDVLKGVTDAADESGLEYHYGYYGGTIIGKPGEIIRETTPIAHGVLVRILRVRGDKTDCIVEYIDRSPTYVYQYTAVGLR